MEQDTVLKATLDVLALSALSVRRACGGEA
jgi:hypothetical protein